ncbi:uncharacterized protein ACLA_041250 [Aspergillus clavatus NRRL 1]|uniref:Uncharacterized protein n=1 Tax=Aspergillus clavatus (strain ATCC 1007 / CBS 513.65 / DSM 816 / NCTC 3887 / NRRL 1 / QM 1276 / 107) TaxID=344612 RepID=A1CL83_ASPCL|nr:uncharacterized protein ACLA_041250 [Aspergillus clavatus NRRL 1]EAW09907.1 conserved hypothetical protein [Aspergillus clavatus NRRL 1]
MSTSSATDSSRESSYPSSPVSQHNQPVFSFPVPQRRRRPISPVRRYYSTPLREDSPDSTPLHLYGLEQREPSIAEKPRLLHRFSYALDDIKEDFTLQLDPKSHMANKIRSRRQSMLMAEASPRGSTSSGIPPVAEKAPLAVSGAPRLRPLSILSFDSWSPPTRMLSRRLSTFEFSKRKRNGPGPLASISQPNLIGSSADI